MTVPANNDAAQVREALDTIRAWLPPMGATSIPEEPIKPAQADQLHKAVRVLAATAERADKQEAWAKEGWDRADEEAGRARNAEEKLGDAEAALLAAQQDFSREQTERIIERSRAERAETTVTRLRKTLAILAECGEVTVEEIARAALAQDTEQESA